ncbi:MAG: VCBS repeat-containing protein, partial [Thermodesulfobacteriota bacterium]|nr:VCBS repeat-containing protein [Thermodesulfobacteriota bacterium]
MKTIFFVFVWFFCSTLQAGAVVNPPVLKWKEGGCYSSWCETGWYSSPAVADLDGNGTMEIVASAYSVVVLQGATGDVLWRVDSGKDRSSPPGFSHRTWSGIWIKDVDGDITPEIITAHSGGYVSVYDNQGYFKSGWPKRPTTNELRGLVVSDIDRDGTAEIIVTGATYNKTNTWVYEHDGILRPGWPQLANDSGYAHGVFNDNGSAGDVDGDGTVEIIIPSDVHYICAYRPDGVQVQANPMYGDRKWGAVGIWESIIPELRGWGACSGDRTESYRTNFANGASVIADVDGDNVNEVIVTGNVY